MTGRKNLCKKALSILLCAVMLFSAIPFAIAVQAADDVKDTRVADPSTMDDWKKLFLKEMPNTEMAGGIWTDKSVFTDASLFPDAVEMNNPHENFLVALSAISANKSITGYSQVPTDTVLVLDISRSMGANTRPGDNNNDAVASLVEGANSAIKKLLDANNNNRVAVVLYSGTYSAELPADSDSAVVLLPLGRYQQADGVFLEKDNHIFNIGEVYFTSESIRVNSQVKSDNGEVELLEREVFGGSFVQGGLYEAMRELLSVEDTTVENDTFQSGTKRLPVVVLMSDGVATSATTNYMGDGNQVGTADMGDGSTPEDELATAIPFATQLTCAYAKARISEHYGRESLFYTLGYKVNSTPVLDPANSTQTDAHWETYHATEKDGFMQLAVSSKYVSNGWWGEGHWDTQYKTIEKSDYDLDKNYVDEFYYTSDDLKGSFNAITDRIIQESLYYPTQVDSGNTDLDGYVEFIDDIGLFMEVKKVHGIQLGETLFTGGNIASNFIGDGGKLGTIDKPSNLGDEMIRAVKARLGIETTADAQKLVDDAYKAGQLAYNSETGEYSNYIGWYADEKGKYICHGTRQDKEYPAGAVYYNESYGYLGEVDDGHKDSDMMYVSVQVHNHIETGNSAVIYRIPASLIPLITYNVTLSGDSLKNPGEVTFEVDTTMKVDSDNDGISDSDVPIAPIRLLFEVGLKDTINELNVSEMVPKDYKYEENGVYTFYTNRWSDEEINHEHPSLAQNTVSFYEPSVENERYYYTENATVYRMAGEEYVPYRGAQSPENCTEPLYREYAVFEAINHKPTGNGRVHLHYEQMSKEALKVSKPADETLTENTTWYVPKGTVHRMFGSFHAAKGGFSEDRTQAQANLTESLMYSHYFKVEKTPDGSSYYSDMVLGNNGKITVTQAQGIKLTVDTDITLQGAEDKFTFELSADPVPEKGIKIVKSDGTQQELSFEQGVVQTDLSVGDVAYILGLPTGTQVTLKELTEDKEYKVESVNAQSTEEFSAVIEQNSMVNAQFVNTLKPPVNSAAMILQNSVTHPFTEDYEVPEDLEFVYSIEYTDETGTSKSQQVTLRPYEIKRITDIPLGATVIVKETDLPAGFTSDAKDNEKAFVAQQEKYYIVSVENEYTPEKVSPVINLTGEKNLYGREGGMWLESDIFTFNLQKLENTGWEILADTTVTKDNRLIDLSFVMSEECYRKVGVYSYRVMEAFEENPHSGITYDQSVRWFDIYVTDKDMDGKLEIDTIKPYGGTTADRAEDGSWNIHADFTNTYSVAGSDSVSVIVRSETKDSTGATSPAQGYEYGLYQGDKLVTLLPATNAQGETIVTLTYGVFDIGKHIHYVLRQMPVEDMAYSTREYNIAVEVEDNNLGGVEAHLTVRENAEGAESVTGDEIQVVFTNTPETEPDVTEPEETKPEEPVIPPPSQDATGNEEAGKDGVTDMPQTGFISTMNTALWWVFLAIMVAGLLGAIFIGRKKK